MRQIIKFISLLGTILFSKVGAPLEKIFGVVYYSTGKHAIEGAKFVPNESGMLNSILPIGIMVILAIVICIFLFNVNEKNSKIIEILNKKSKKKNKKK